MSTTTAGASAKLPPPSLRSQTLRSRTIVRGLLVSYDQEDSEREERLSGQGLSGQGLSGQGLIDITFSSGRTARAVVSRPDVAGDELVARLALPPARGVLAVNGSTAEEAAPSSGLVDDVVERVGGAILDHQWTAVTGATDAGIFRLLGRAAEAAGKLPAPWIGVAPLGLVTWPGRTPPAGTDLVPLEPHHSHFVLVDADRWGDETPALLALTKALGAGGCATAAVMVGGGAVARTEALGHALAGRPIVVLGGSGRLADELAGMTTGVSPDDEDLAMIRRSGRVIVCQVADGPSVTAALRRALR